MKYFDLRILNRFPTYHMVYLELQEEQNKFILNLKELEKLEDERYI